MKPFDLLGLSKESPSLFDLTCQLLIEAEQCGVDARYWDLFDGKRRRQAGTNKKSDGAINYHYAATRVVKDGVLFTLSLVTHSIVTYEFSVMVVMETYEAPDFQRRRSKVGMVSLNSFDPWDPESIAKQLCNQATLAYTR